jgi:hypothetical protein
MRSRRGDAFLGAAVVLLIACGSSTGRTPDSTGNSGGSGGTAGDIAKGGDVAKGGSATLPAGEGGSGTDGGTPATGGVTQGGSSTAGASSGGAGGKPASAGAAGAGQSPTLEGCALWEVITAPGSTSTATLLDGALHLVRPGGPPDSGGFFGSNGVDVVQRGLTGDFDVVVSFEGFVQGDTEARKGPYFNAGVYGGATAVARGMVGMQITRLNVSIDGMGNTRSTLHAPDATWLEDASGSFQFRRQGTEMTATVTVGALSESESSPLPFDAESLSLFIGIGNGDEDLGLQESAIKITSVEVTGGGGVVKSDSFDCE